MVFAGGGLGAVARAAILQAFGARLAPFPPAVLLVNCLGAFVLGVVFVLADEGGLMRTETRLFLAVGLLGGFTTFSTFGWGVDVLLGQHAWQQAILYLTTGVVGGMLAVAAGLMAGRELLALLERVAQGVLNRLEARRTGVARQDMNLVETEDREESA